MQIASGSTANQTRTLCPMVAINALRNSLDLVLIALTALTFGLADDLAQVGPLPLEGYAWPLFAAPG